MALEEFKEEIEQLLQNITEEHPCGANIKNTEVFEKIQDMRIVEDATIPQGEWQSESKPPQWKEMALGCRDILQNNSKDLQIAAFLVEAEMHVRSFKGMAFGLLLFQELAEKFWENIYPPLNPELPELRTTPFRWLDRNITALVNQEILSERQSAKSKDFSYSALEAAKVAGNAEEAKTKARLVDSLGNENAAWLEAQISYIGQSLESLNLLDEKLASIEGIEDGINLTLLQSLLEKVTGLFQEGLKKAQARSAQGSVAPEDSAEEGGVEGEGQGEARISTKGGFPVIRTREDAYRVIEFANNELLKLEPHSPSPYLIRRALDWKSKNMYELFLDIFSSVQNPAEIFNLLGLKGDAAKKQAQGTDGEEGEAN